MFGIRVDERYAVDRLRALQELLENRHLRRFPPTQKTGFPFSSFLQALIKIL
jgi:hypothetical protein